VTHWHSGYGSLEAFVQKRLGPAPELLLGAAMAVNEVRAGVEPTNLLQPPEGLCTSTHVGEPHYAEWAATPIADGLY
jgi:hypothetical protein